MIVVAVGGIIDGALYVLLFTLYAGARGLSGTQATLLLSCLGLGGMALQFPVGWTADRAGLVFTVIMYAMTSTLALVTFALATPMMWLFPASGLVVIGMNSAFITPFSCELSHHGQPPHECGAPRCTSDVRPIRQAGLGPFLPFGL